MSMLNEIRNADYTPRDRSIKGKMKDLFPWKGDDIREIVRKLIYLAAVAVLIYSCYGVITYKFGTSDLHESKDELSNLYYHGSENTDNNNNAAVTLPAVTSPSDDNIQQNVPENDDSSDSQTFYDPELLRYPAGMLMDRFKGLYDRNPDVIGWLTIDGLADPKGANYIDYPVMQTTNNDYYLDHDFFGQEKNYGALFADCNVRITRNSRPRNTIIYGHNMGAGTYFSHLHDYKKRVSFLSEHRLVTYTTLWEENQYIIIGCFLTGVREDQDNIPIFRYHVVFDFANISDFDYWYKNVLYRSYYTSDIPCTMDDEYLTLSTCSNEIYDSRFVVVARKLREGEDPWQYNYFSNPDARKPAAFYEAYGMSVPKDNGPDYEYYGKENTQTKGIE